jgi:hypothetical protein
LFVNLITRWWSVYIYIYIWGGFCRSLKCMEWCWKYQEIVLRVFFRVNIPFSIFCGDEEEDCSEGRRWSSRDKF